MNPKAFIASVGALSVLAVLLIMLGYSAVSTNSPKPVSTSTPLNTPTPVTGFQPNSNGAMDRANVHGTGVYITKGVQQLNGLKWKFKTNNGAVDTAAVVQGSVVYFGAYGRLYAVNTDTGIENWNFKADNLNTTAPAIADDTIYVGAWETFYALSTDRGVVKWSFEPENGSGDRYYANPSVEDGIVYFGGWDKFYALDSKTGKERWKLKLDGIVESAPVVYDGIVYFGTSSPDGRNATYFYALDSKTGQERWKLRASGDGIVGSAAAVDGVVYVGTWTDGLLALDAKSGQEKWRFNPGSGVLTSPAVAYDTVYIVDRGTLYAVQAKTGKEKWRVASGDNGLYSDPIIADGIVYFITTNLGFGVILNLTQPVGHLHAIDAQSGREQWVFSAPDVTSRTPVIADSVIYFGAEEDYLYAIK